MARKKQLLVPEARAALDELKQSVVRKATGTPSERQETVKLRKLPADKGEWTARAAGKAGGDIGGPMVEHLIHIAEAELAKDTGARRAATGPRRHDHGNH